MAQRPEDFPLVTGVFELSSRWAIDLGELDFRHREEDQTVVWRPGMTLYLACYDYPKGTTPERFLEERRADDERPAGAKLLPLPDAGDVRFFGYSFEEEDDERGTRRAIQAFVLGPKLSGFVTASIYFDRAADLTLAKRLWGSIALQGPAKPARPREK